MPVPERVVVPVPAVSRHLVVVTGTEARALEVARGLHSTLRASLACPTARAVGCGCAVSWRAPALGRVVAVCVGATASARG